MDNCEEAGIVGDCSRFHIRFLASFVSGSMSCGAAGATMILSMHLMLGFKVWER